MSLCNFWSESFLEFVGGRIIESSWAFQRLSIVSMLLPDGKKMNYFNGLWMWKEEKSVDKKKEEQFVYFGWLPIGGESLLNCGFRAKWMNADCKVVFVWIGKHFTKGGHNFNFHIKFPLSQIFTGIIDKKFPPFFTSDLAKVVKNWTGFGGGNQSEQERNRGTRKTNFVDISWNYRLEDLKDVNKLPLEVG